MSGKPNVLLLGDDTRAKWHPLEPVKRQLERILGGEFALAGTEDYRRLAWLDRAEFALCISYADAWDRRPTPEQVGGLLRFVASGGGLLAIHNGISLQQSPELLQMIGARFTGHPPYTRLRYCAPDAEHPVLDGVADFSMEEEPYMFDFAPFADVRGFLEFEWEGKRYPAAWERRYGLGKVVYLQPGHHAPSFQPEMYRRLVLNSARWAVARWD